MAFKFIVFAAFVAVARAGHLGGLSYASPAVVGSHDSISTYSSVQQHAPAVHTYSAYAPAVHTYSAYAPDVHTYSAHAPAVHSYSAYAPAVHTYSAQAPVAHTYAAPIAHAVAAPVVKTVYAEPSAPANYDFGYAVSDPHTGDAKSQHESRHGDVVKGSYSLLESDGTKRIVDYTADAHNGFNAVVHKEGAPIAVKTVAPVAYSAPVVAKVAAPLAYSTPVAHAYASPVAHGYTGQVANSYSSSVAHGYAAPVSHGLAHGYAAPYAHKLW